MDPAVVGTGVVAFWANHNCGINAGCSCLVGATTTLCALVYASDQNDRLSHHYYSTRLINHAKSKFFDVFPCMAARFNRKERIMENDSNTNIQELKEAVGHIC